MTPFDKYTTSQSLQLTKLLIPFLPPMTQRTIAIFIKFWEFRNTVSTFYSMKQDSSSSDDIFNSLKQYMNSSDLESFEQMMNMMNMMKEMSDMPFDPTEMMMGMFTQENHHVTQEEGEKDDGLDERSKASEHGPN